jgi:hypothetical protein
VRNLIRNKFCAPVVKDPEIPFLNHLEVKMWKRLIIVTLLVAIAAIAGMVRAHKGAGLSDFKNATGQTREEKRESYELAPGARVEVFNINGSVNIETSDSKIADIYIERSGPSAESLNRRRVDIEYNSNTLKIYGSQGSTGFWARLFSSSPSERVTLKLPRQIALLAKGVNGPVVAGDVEGSLEVRGVNGRVQVGSASGTADLRGINGTVVLALKQLNLDAVSLSGINGNIELRLAPGLNGYLDVRGINGQLVADGAPVSIEKGRRGRYWAQIGSGGNSITAKGINGNIRVTIPVATPTTAEAEMKTATVSATNGQ